MKVVFLQQECDCIGGVLHVNCALGNAFLQSKDEVFYVSLRKRGLDQKIPYPANATQVIINEQDVWDVPRYEVAVRHLKKGHFVQAGRQILNRLRYDKKLHQDFEACKQLLSEINPDAIIVSHYECLYAIPQHLLKRSFAHFHNTFKIALQYESMLKCLKEFESRIASCIWLSEATCELAKQHGIHNSNYVYNPINFESTELTTGYHSKQAIFIGRIAEQKRVDLLIRLFEETCADYQIEDWQLKIYGVGELSDSVQDALKKASHVQFMGATHQVKEELLKSSLMLLASDYEGLPLVVIEANECGVPCLAYHFGESVFESILDGQTGYIIDLDDHEAYKQRLAYLMTHEEVLEKLGHQAKEYAKQFQITKIVERWKELFNEVSS